MLTHHIALVSQTSRITTPEIRQVTAALQKQATRDLGPAWGIRASLAAFGSIREVPAGHWPIIVQDDIREPGAEGYHTDRNHQPYALVRYSATWALTASHELCEMLVDPYGNRMAPAASILKGQGPVNYIVEVCDPCESSQYAYEVDGIPLSDF
jgi:hypothetical protein